MRKLLLWDFDGVIVDSMEECLLTSYKAFLKFQGNDDSGVKRVADIPLAIQKEFRATRQYVRGAGEYFVLYQAMLTDCKLKDYSAFNQLLAKHQDIISQYHKLFYQTRKELRSDAPDYWMGLHLVYSWIKNNWAVLSRSFDFYIVSNKDSESIRLILKKNKMEIDPKNIFGMDFSLGKTEIIRHILSITQAAGKDVSFIDDNYYHLRDVGDLGIALYFASWGYGQMPQKTGGIIAMLDADNFNERLVESHEKTVC